MGSGMKVSADQILDAARESANSDPRESTMDIVLRKTGAPYKVVLRKMEKMVKRGELEYGVSIDWSWPA